MEIKRCVSHLEKDRRTISQERSGSIPRCKRYFRTRREDSVAHSSARSDADRHFGLGRVQKLGGPVEEIRPGDVVWFEPNEKHWHGASPTVAMTHIAIQEALDGKVVDWLENVSEDDYRS